MKNKIKYLLVCVCLFLFIVGCSNISTPAHPDGVREEIYKSSIKYYYLIDTRVNKNEIITLEEQEEIQNFSMKYDENKLTLTERKIIVGLLYMIQENIQIDTAQKTKDKQLEDESLRNYVIERNKVKMLLEI